MAHTAATVKTEIAAMLQKTGVSAMESHWDQRIATALAKATNLIESILIGERGFTSAQVAAWDMLDDVTMSQTLYFVFAFMRGDYFTWDQIQSWDQTKFLRSVSILDAAEAPVTTETTVSGGLLDDGVHAVDLNDDSAANVDSPRFFGD